ncbi:MAG: Asp-tRNA(Asn)/Glu-tRNA(Gln) amidotransferase subunit GatC [Thermacetogeniaceae bacterium]|jgi:aspartyl-tRNA(Asn)/glutamyl-tRNA(Gln) amidotransferase subunit C|nr:Asp-tRNA(Asn)/Glu-tRNA(Gln) amidotransferase subunit GatC [Syntrophomonadaceae bacterium]
MVLSRKDMEELAVLAQIALDEEELADLQSQLNNLLRYVETINEIDTENVEPTFYLLPLQNVWRQDEDGRQPLAAEEVFQNALEQERGFFKVPRIL